MNKRNSNTSWLAWLVTVVVLVAVVGGGLWLWQRARQPGPQTTAGGPAATGSAGAAAPATAPPPERHPIAEAAPAAAATAPLPALDASDADVSGSLLAVLGGKDMESVLLRRQLVRRIVATVDALPRQAVGQNILPLRAPGGSFEVDQGPDGTMTLSPRNAARYATYMRIVESADPKTLVAWYVRYYPLFEQAYHELGYPHGHFNDRLVQAIDDMLAAPAPGEPVGLVRPKVLYNYADADLQGRSAGQRLMMRIGRGNEARVKAKLRAIRAQLTGGGVPAAPSSAGGAATQR